MGGLDIDRFATAANTLLPRFNSYFAEQGSCGTDAFAQNDWAQLRNFCNPPFSQLPRLLQYLSNTAPTAICVVIAPKWVQQHWFQGFFHLADTTLLLPHRPDLVRIIQGDQTTPPYLKNRSWRLCAFIINTPLVSPPPFPKLRDTYHPPSRAY